MKLPGHLARDPWDGILVVLAGASAGLYLIASAPSPPRLQGLLLAATVAGVVALWRATSHLASRPAPLGRAWFLGGLILAGFAPIFALAGQHPAVAPGTRWYVLGVALAAAAVAHWAILAPKEPGHGLSARDERLALAGLITAYILAFIGLSAYRWRILTLGNVDSAIIIQSFRYTLDQGRVLYNTLEKTSHLGVHNSPIYFLLLPLYALCRRPDLFLILVPPLAVGLSGLPFHRLARERLEALPALLLTAAYLLAPYMAARSQGDLYEMTLLPAVLVPALYHYQKGHLGRFVLWALLCLAVKESIAATIIMFGLYSLIQRRGLAWALLPLGLGVASLALSYGVIMPHFGGGAVSSRTADVLGPLGPTPWDALRLAIQQPIHVLRLVLTLPKAALAYQLIQPALFLLPLLGGEALLALPALALNLLAQGGSVGIRAWESAIFAPLLFAATASGIRLASRKWALLGPSQQMQRRTATFLAIGVLFSTLACMPYWLRADDYLPAPYLGAQRQGAALIPPEASLSAPDYMMAHFAERDVLQLQTGAPFWAEYHLVDMHWIEALRGRRIPERAANEYAQLVAATETGGVHQGLRRIWAKDGIYVFHLEGP